MYSTLLSQGKLISLTLMFPSFLLSLSSGYTTWTEVESHHDACGHIDTITTEQSLSQVIYTEGPCKEPLEQLLWNTDLDWRFLSRIGSPSTTGCPSSTLSSLSGNLSLSPKSKVWLWVYQQHQNPFNKVVNMLLLKVWHRFNKIIHNRVLPFDSLSYWAQNPWTSQDLCFLRWSWL